MTEPFEDRLSKEIDLFLHETADGCVDCIAIRRRKGTKKKSAAFCPEHTRLCLKVINNPRKYIKIGKLKKTTS